MNSIWSPAAIRIEYGSLTFWWMAFAVVVDVVVGVINLKLKMGCGAGRARDRLAER
jgi:hypothetical protein